MILIAVSVFVACKKDKDLDETTTTTSNTDVVTNDDQSDLDVNDDVEIKSSKIHISFRHKVDDEIVMLDTIRYRNAAGNDYSIERLKYFVSNFEFQGKKATIATDDVFYVDMDDTETYTFEIPQPLIIDTFLALRFTFGLDSEANYTDAFTDEPESKMAWPDMMGGGYHHMKLEGKFNDADTVKNYAIHTGGLNGALNHINYEFVGDTIFSVGTDIYVTIDMDINAWMAVPNQCDLVNFGMIMGDSTAQRMIKENGQYVFSLSKIN